MNIKPLIAMSILLFSCNNMLVKKQDVDSLVTKNNTTIDTAAQNKPGNRQINIFGDSTSSDYLKYALKNKIGLNNHWTLKLNELAEFVLPADSMSHLSITHEWTINDSISVIILNYTTGTSYDEFLLPIKNKKDFVSKIHISNQADSDLSLQQPHYYTEYKLISDRKIKLFNHKVVGTEGGEEKDKILSTENWSIQDNGKVLKK